MNMEQINKALIKQFNEPLKDEEVRQLIFWTDIEEGFVHDFSKIKLDNVKIVHLTEHNQFSMKHLLEEEDVDSSYLIYTNLDLSSKRNWLYDTVLYSKTFYADRLSLIMDELKIDHSLRGTVEQYQRFFNNQDRYKRFKSFNIHTYTKDIIELAMMNVICKTHALDFEPVLRTVLMDTLADEDNQYLSDLEKFFSIDTFWSFVEREYDYQRDQKTLKTLFIHLTITAFSQSISEEYLTKFSHFIAEYNRTNAFVFIDHWMHHKTDYSTYYDYITAIENEIQLAEVINKLPVDLFKDADVFPYVDRKIITYVANNLIDQQEDFETYIKLIQLRRTKHFYKEYEHIYEALFYVVKMYEFKKRFTHGIPQDQAVHIYKSYVEDYYKMDLYYRKFYVSFDADKNNELLLKLKPLVEYTYTTWFMGELSAHWSKALKVEMVHNWSLPGVNSQQRFYSDAVASHIYNDERVFIIISDALRYEVGTELNEKIKSEIIGEVKMDTMLGVIPSLTKLGMAALLPHQELTINDKGHVLSNGKSTSGLENRKKTIEEANEHGLAVHYDTLQTMTVADQRELFKGKKLIYIYHDTIDAVGDHAATEIDTFNAVEQTVNELAHLIRSLVNNISATNLYITADHGFLYERDELEVTDLMTKESIAAFEFKRRYILSEEEKEVSGQLAINLSSILKNEMPLYAYVPNATMRYRIQGGGANFVHGGASLQEVVIPLLSIKRKRSGQSGAKEKEKVTIQLTSTMRNITNSIFSLDFFQNERVSGHMTPRKVAIYMEDEAEQMLSNEKIIIGDLTSDNPKERIFKLNFVLKNRAYDKDKTYYLLIKDVETDVIVDKIPFSINLGIVSDFDF